MTVDFRVRHRLQGIEAKFGSSCPAVLSSCRCGHVTEGISELYGILRGSTEFGFWASYGNGVKVMPRVIVCVRSFADFDWRFLIKRTRKFSHEVMH